LQISSICRVPAADSGEDFENVLPDFDDLLPNFFDVFSTKNFKIEDWDDWDFGPSEKLDIFSPKKQPSYTFPDFSSEDLLA